MNASRYMLCLLAALAALQMPVRRSSACPIMASDAGGAACDMQGGGQIGALAHFANFCGLRCLHFRYKLADVGTMPRIDQPSFAVIIETLEGRTLMSAINLIDGVLHLTGDSTHSNAITVRLKGKQLDVTVNATRQRILVSAVANIQITGGEARDNIRVYDNVRFDAFVSAGAGDDTIRTGSGNDTIDGGSGKDSIKTGAGNDVVFSDVADRIKDKSKQDKVTPPPLPTPPAPTPTPTPEPLPAPTPAPQPSPAPNPAPTPENHDSDIVTPPTDDVIIPDDDIPPFDDESGPDVVPVEDDSDLPPDPDPIIEPNPDSTQGPIIADPTPDPTPDPAPTPDPLPTPDPAPTPDPDPVLAPDPDKPVTGPVLHPGAGFTAATAQPATILAGAKYGDAKAIARWDVVPYQTFDKTFNVGVVAFHAAGIDRVEFSVNGGEWVAVRTMTNNPQVNVTEYWATLNAADFKDGAIEVRAVAYPKVGVARVLNSLSLNSNASGLATWPELHVNPSTGNDANPGTASQPFATLKRALRKTPDGAKIIIDEAGRYDANRYSEGGLSDVKNTRWITVRPAEGISERDVIIIGGATGRAALASRINRVKFQDVSFDWSSYAYFQPSEAVWFDRCRFFDPNGIGANYVGQMGITPFRGNSYVTASTSTDQAYGFVNCELVRECHVSRVADAFQNSRFVVNSVVDSMNVTDIAEQHHPDIFQYFGNQENVIVYGVAAHDVAGAQVLFVDQPIATGDTMTNCAFVNITADVNPENAGGPPYSQMQGTLRHVLFTNITMVNQQLYFRTDVTGANRFNGYEVLVSDSHLNATTYKKYVLGAVLGGVDFESCYSGL